MEGVKEDYLMAREVSISFGELEARDLAKKKKKEEKEIKESQPRQIVVNRDPAGLYFVSFDGGGKVPAVLAGFWTKKAKLEEMITRYNLEMKRIPVTEET
jgi:hypothetical protein